MVPSSPAALFNWKLFFRISERDLQLQPKLQLRPFMMLKKLSSLRKQIHLLILLGYPGAGKGLIGSIIETLLSPTEFRLVLMSALIDARSKGTDPLALALQEQAKVRKAGGLVKDEPVMQTLEENVMLSEEEGARCFMFDGCIRTLGQGKALLASHVPFTTLYLEVSEDVAFERICRRAKIEGRFDDADPKTIRNRLDTYKKETAPVIKLLKNHNPSTFHRIDCERAVRTNIAEILRVMGYRRRELQEMMSNLDRPSHPAFKLLQKALESERLHQSGGVHMIPEERGESLQVTTPAFMTRTPGSVPEEFLSTR